MKHFYIYDNTSGLIEFIGTSNEPQYCNPNQTFTFCTDRINVAEQYHDTQTNTLSTRPDIAYTLSKPTIIADGTDTLTISGLPNPCQVTWPDGLQSEVTDGEIIFGTDLPGFHEFKLEAFPYKDLTITVEATE